MKAILYYIHDPMCSWCWGFSRVYNQLLEKLPREIEVQRLLGGLAKDTDIAMPVDMQETIKSNWLRIEEHIAGIKFNFDFWHNNIPRRSTYPACRAVIAAREQGQEKDSLMTEAIQRAYYKQARNPSDENILIELAKEIGLEQKRFIFSFKSQQTTQQLKHEIEFSRELFVESYPSLVLKVGERLLPIEIDYQKPLPMLDKIADFIKESSGGTDII